MTATAASADLEKLGPLAWLAGVWEGGKGDDLAPSDDRGTENNKFRERIVFDPIGMVNNHEQTLYGLRYSTTAWRLGAQGAEPAPFHEEVGYWLWDAEARQVMRCFLVPRGVSVIAGGTVAPGSTEFTLVAELGSPTFGICSNPFLDREFRTERYEVRVKRTESGDLEYWEETSMAMPGRDKRFSHTDQNVLRKVKS